MTTTATAAPITTSDLIVGKFTANPEASYLAKQLVDATGKSRTSVNDSLKKLAETGVVIRMDKDGVALWSLTPTRKAALKRAAKKAAKSAAPKARKTTTAPATRTATRTTKDFTVTEATEGTARTDTNRRKKGAVDFEIRAYFEGVDNTPAGSYAVAKAIGSRAGTTYVALRRMAAEGKARLVSTEPDRYEIDFDNAGWNEIEAE